MVNAIHVTATKRVKAQYKSDEQAVLYFTGMSLGELVDYKLDTGKRWITLFCVNELKLPEAVASELWKQPILLQWWGHEWKRFDHYYVVPFLHKIVEGERENVYRSVHESVFLSSHPANSLMIDALRRLIVNCKL